jgi:hypothetical protein
MNNFATSFIKRYLLRRSLFVVIVFSAVTLFSVKYAESRKTGITGQTDKAGDGQGCTCHCGASNPNTVVTISTSATAFEVNKTYTFTIKVENSTEVNGGCDVACDNGTLTAGGDGLQKIGSQLTHTAPKGLPATWTFTYTAPAVAGTDIIYAAGNAVNGDLMNNGGACLDNWNFANHFVINVTAPTKGLTVSTSTIDFGSKRVTTSSNLTATVNSVGPDAALTISSSPLTTGTQFSNSPTTTNRTISVGSSETETITFAPTARGSFTDELTINSDATVVADQVKKITIKGKGINGEFSGATSFAFDKVRVGTTKQLTYTFTNSGDDTTFLSNPTVTGIGFSIVTPPANLNIPPGASASVVIKFSPGEKKAYTGTLNMTAQNNVVIPAIALTGTGIAPVLSLSSSFVDMGTTFVGGILASSVVITNVGDDDLHVSGITLTQTGTKFTLPSGSGFTVVPAGSATINFSYTSPSESVDNATITINSDDLATASRQVPISARSGVPKMSLNTKDTINFGSVRIGSPALAPLSISNIGTYDLTIQVGDFSPSQFSLSSSPATIAPQAKVDAMLQFIPTAEGLITGMVIVRSNDDHNSIDTVYLKGVGVNSALDIPSSIDFHDLNLNKTRDSIITLRNLGTGSAKVFKYKLTDASNGFILLDTVAHSLPPKDSIRIKIRFAPTQEISYSATLSVITDDAASERKILLSGKGVNSKLSTDVSLVDFGQIDTGTNSVKKFTITNNGSAAAIINSIKVNGSNVFTLSDEAFPLTILPTESKIISVTFSPKTESTFDATAIITATEGSPISVNLHGKGKVTVIIGSVKDIAKEMGISLSLSPNPSQGSAAISLTLTKPAEIDLALFDANGKLVHNFGLSHFEPGLHSFSLSPEYLQSGEYYLRAVANGVIAAEVKAMVIQ